MVAQHLRYFVWPTSTPVVICLADVIVIVARSFLGDCPDVLITPVTRRRQHANSLAADFEPAYQLADTGNGCRVVPVVQNHAERVLVEHIHPPRGLEDRGIEGLQSMPDVIQGFTHTESERCGKHGVLYVMSSLPFHGCRNQVRP